MSLISTIAWARWYDSCSARCANTWMPTSPSNPTVMMNSVIKISSRLNPRCRRYPCPEYFLVAAIARVPVAVHAHARHAVRLDGDAARLDRIHRRDVEHQRLGARGHAAV